MFQNVKRRAKRGGGGAFQRVKAWLTIWGDYLSRSMHRTAKHPTNPSLTQSHTGAPGSHPKDGFHFARKAQSNTERRSQITFSGHIWPLPSSALQQTVQQHWHDRKQGFFWIHTAYCSQCFPYIQKSRASSVSWPHGVGRGGVFTKRVTKCFLSVHDDRFTLLE